MANRIQLRRGTAADWTAKNPVLAQGEPGIETDTGKAKYGDGVKAWTALPYAAKGDTGASSPEAAAAAAEATAAKVAAQQAAGLVGAPAGAAVLAAIQPGGAAHGVLSGTIEAQVATSPAVEEKLSKTEAATTYAPTVPDGLEAWRLALANRDYARADIACLGDSVTEGRGATAYSRNWVHKLQTGLRKRLGVTGGYGYMPARLTDTNTYANPTTNNGQIFVNQSFGVKGHMSLIVGGSTITYNIVGTHADIIYLSGGATGVMSIIVDGSAPQTLTTAEPTLQTKRHRLTLGTSGPHTITIGWVSGPEVFLDGVIIYDGDTTAGIGAHDCGHTGWTTGDWMANGSEWPNQIKAAFQPDLWVIGLGINDSYGAPASPNISVAQYKTNLGNIITNIHNATTNDPSILLHTSIPRKPTTSGYGAYVTAMRELAAERGVAFFDHLPRWPKSEETGGWYVDGTHPSDIGYSALADGLAEFLAPR